MTGTTKPALVATLGVLVVGGGVAGVSVAQSARHEQPRYRSSIQVPNNGREEQGGAKEQAGAESAGARQETTQPQALARVTADQARAAALAHVLGQATQVSLDKEDGNLVYSVNVRDAQGKVHDVKVDAGNAQVLHVEQDGEG